MSLNDDKNKELTTIEKIDKYGIVFVMSLAIVIFPITLIILTWLFWAEVK